jgi:hypothetical protein
MPAAASAKTRVVGNAGRGALAVLGGLGFVALTLSTEACQRATPTLYGAPPDRGTSFRVRLEGDVAAEMDLVRRYAEARGCAISEKEKGFVVTCDGVDVAFIREETALLVECNAEPRGRCEQEVDLLRAATADAGPGETSSSD